MKKISLILTAFIFLVSCKKKESINEEVSFEIECEDCSVSYTSDNGKDMLYKDVKKTFSKKYTYIHDIEILITTKTICKIIFYRKAYGSTYSIFSDIYDSDMKLIYNSANRIVSDGKSSSNGGSYGCGSYNGKSLYLGPKGGCYYLTNSGNKTYVDRSYCKCN